MANLEKRGGQSGIDEASSDLNKEISNLQDQINDIKKSYLTLEEKDSLQKSIDKSNASLQKSIDGLNASVTSLQKDIAFIKQDIVKKHTIGVLWTGDATIEQSIALSESMLNFQAIVLIGGDTSWHEPITIPVPYFQAKLNERDCDHSFLLEEWTTTYVCGYWQDDTHIYI